MKNSLSPAVPTIMIAPPVSNGIFPTIVGILPVFFVVHLERDIVPVSHSFPIHPLFQSPII
jgi:hypothetical protein